MYIVIMLLVGLTGGIASGKTTVSKMFVELGVHLIDADLIARDVVEPEKPAWREIIAVFGNSILNKKKGIDRKKLGTLVFNNLEKRKQLEAITHPKIIVEENRQVNELKKKYRSGIILLDAALLIEAGHHDRVDKLIVVYTDKKIQLKRLTERNNLSPDDAKKRIDSQMSLEEKAKLSDYTIDNNKPFEEVRNQVSKIYSELVSIDIDSEKK